MDLDCCDNTNSDPSVIFTPLTVDDRTLYDHYYGLTRPFISDLSFTSRMAWLSGFHYHKAEIAGALVIAAQAEVFTKLHFSAPLGLTSCSQMKEIIEALWNPYAGLSGFLAGDSPCLSILFVSEQDLHCYEGLRNYGYDVEISKKDEYSDYLYDAEKLRTLSGKSLHSKKNHLNHFLSQYPHAEYRSMSSIYSAEALELTRRWCEAKGLDPNDIRNSDYPAIKAVFDNYERLNVQGGSIWIDGKLVAFSLYSHPFADVAFCHFEKSAPDFEEAYVPINTLTLRNEFPNVKFVNREEDMGIEGLRKVKQSYHPVSMVEKYEVIVTIN